MPDRTAARPAFVLALAILLAALALGSVGTAPPARALGYSPQVDEHASYDAQTTCTRAAKPGTVALSRWLLRTYRSTRSMGLMRACSTGGRSEHKDGRAFDWGADVRRKAQRRAAYHFIRTALASDANDNAHALARRLGIMYFIYDDKIWSSYRGFAPRPYLHSACKTLRKCSRTLRHRDHVHISLSFAGAAAQTSWYRARNVPSQPVLFAGSRDLDPRATAVTPLIVPATGATVTSSYRLRAGVTYRLVATGTVRHAAGLAGDATCAVTAGAAAYAPTPRGTVVLPSWVWDFGHPDSPFALPTLETRGVLVDGALRWEGDCQADHTYQAWFTPTTTQPLKLRYADPVPGDNVGTVTVYVARDDITRTSLKR